MLIADVLDITEARKLRYNKKQKIEKTSVRIHLMKLGSVSPVSSPPT